MAYGMLKILIGTLSICVISSGAFLHAECSIVSVKGGAYERHL